MEDPNDSVWLSFFECQPRGRTLMASSSRSRRHRITTFRGCRPPVTKQQHVVAGESAFPLPGTPGSSTRNEGGSAIWKRRPGTTTSLVDSMGSHSGWKSLGVHQDHVTSRVVVEFSVGKQLWQGQWSSCKCSVVPGNDMGGEGQFAAFASFSCNTLEDPKGKECQRQWRSIPP